MSVLFCHRFTSSTLSKNLMTSLTATLPLLFLVEFTLDALARSQPSIIGRILARWVSIQRYIYRMQWIFCLRINPSSLHTVFCLIYLKVFDANKISCFRHSMAGKYSRFPAVRVLLWSCDGLLPCFLCFVSYNRAFEGYKGTAIFEWRSKSSPVVCKVLKSHCYNLTLVQAGISDIRRNYCPFYQCPHNHHLCSHCTQRVVEHWRFICLSVPLWHCLDPSVLHHITLCQITTSSFCIFSWWSSVRVPKLYLLPN